MVIADSCGGSNSQITQPSSYALVSISPASARVASGGTQQFTATVTGSSNTAVTWSATAGSVSDTGLFTAPAVAIDTSITVKATSQADTTRSASATVTVERATSRLDVSPTNLSFGNVSLGDKLSLRVTLTNRGSADVTISSVNVIGAGFSTGGSIDGTILMPAEWVDLTVGFNPTATGNVTGGITVVTDAANSPATISLSGTGGSNAVNVASFGAVGNGTADDTAAIAAAIAALMPGATLLFPCGTYLTSAGLFINVNNVTVDGFGCATIYHSGGGSNQIVVIGGSGNGSPNYTPAVALSATANELSTSFTAVSNLDVNPGDYVVLEQGGKDGSNGPDSSIGTGDTECDVSGCRGEVVQVASVSGNTVTVTSFLHDTYNPSVNAATARKILAPLTGLTVKNITLDGSGSTLYGLLAAGIVNSTFSGVTAKNVQGAAIWGQAHFNVTWNNITVTGAGSENCGNAVLLAYQTNLSVNDMSISDENSGLGSVCLGNGAFGFGLIESVDGTLTNLSIDAITSSGGRPFKTVASRYNTFNALRVENGASNFNGLSLHYYTSHNTFNSCIAINNGVASETGRGNAGIHTFGSFNQYNTFNNCTVTGNGNVQLIIDNSDYLRLAQDIGNTINGGTYTGTNASEPVMYISGPNTYVTSTYINGPGSQGIYLGSTNACVNNNVFGAATGLSKGIESFNSSNIGSGNVMNGNSSNLAAGTCTGP